MGLSIDGTPKNRSFLPSSKPRFILFLNMLILHSHKIKGKGHNESLFENIIFVGTTHRFRRNLEYVKVLNTRIGNMGLPVFPRTFSL